MAPLVSCIIIFWNAEAFIEEAIQSVLAQSYADWELLLVDDGGSDGSRAIAQRYVAAYPDRIVYLAHPKRQNLGMSAARNLGIRHARGEFVAFLDADDLWLPNKLQEQVAIMVAYPQAGMVYGRTLIWHGWTGHLADRQRDHTLTLGVAPDTVVAAPRLFMLMLENKVQSPTTCNALMRRTLIEQVGGFEESFRGMYEDQAFFAKVQLQTPVYVAGALWAKYRQHPQSCTAQVDLSGDYGAQRLPFLAWLAAYVAKQGYGPSSVVWWRVRWEQWLCRHPHMRRIVELPGMISWQLRRTLSKVGDSAEKVGS